MSDTPDFDAWFSACEAAEQSGTIHDTGVPFLDALTSLRADARARRQEQAYDDYAIALMEKGLDS